MEDMNEKRQRGETRSWYRVPSKDVTANSRRIAQAVDNEEWQKFRASLKGKSTYAKMMELKAYWTTNCDHLYEEDVAECDVCIRVDNYIKALCRGGQLFQGESLKTALAADFYLKVKK